MFNMHKLILASAVSVGAIACEEFELPELEPLGDVGLDPCSRERRLYGSCSEGVLVYCDSIINLCDRGEMVSCDDIAACESGEKLREICREQGLEILKCIVDNLDEQDVN